MSCKKNARGCPSAKMTGTCAKLEVFDWLKDIPNTFNPREIVEVRFKNTRKDYYRNVNDLRLDTGDMVAVESSPGHDIGVVSLVGDLVLKQMKGRRVTYVGGELRKIYRKASHVDIQKWEEAISLEHETMLEARKIAENLGLDMKIGDVEFQGDKTKAIFYYIAEERVDFRQLIRVYADTFKVRIEMKQIGVRQEAGRIGGVGSCGRELCCCSWMTDFVSVSTTAARHQEISLNPQKLAGQCGKLKCCLNYELDCYIDAQKDFPPYNVPLETENATFSFLKADIFNKVYWYAPEKGLLGGVVAVPIDRVREIINLNKEGKKVSRLTNKAESGGDTDKHGYHNAVGEDRLDRFDHHKKSGKKRKKGKSANYQKRQSVKGKNGDKRRKTKGR